MSFYDEAQYHEFNKRHRNQYTVLHTLSDPQRGSSRFYVWVQKTKEIHYTTTGGYNGKKVKQHVWKSTPTKVHQG